MRVLVISDTYKASVEKVQHKATQEAFLASVG